MSNALKNALADMYKPPEYAFMTEVANATGAAKRRSADALAMSMWPSRGLELIGFEIKVSRSDWLREKKNPAKAEEIAPYCHRWYLVTAGPDVVPVDEVPPLWGLMYPCPNKLAVIKVAPERLDVKPLDYIFLAAVMRSFVKDREQYVRISEIQASLNDARKKGMEAGREIFQGEIDRLRKDYEELRGAIRTFQQYTGIRIMKFDLPNISKQLEYAAAELGDFAESLNQAAVKISQGDGNGQ